MRILLVLIFSLGASAMAQQKQPDQQSPSGIEYNDLPPNLRQGVFGDLRAGDTLLEVNERKVQRAKELEEIFKDIKPGSEVKLKYKHDGKVEERKKKNNK